MEPAQVQSELLKAIDRPNLHQNLRISIPLTNNSPFLKVPPRASSAAIDKMGNLGSDAGLQTIFQSIAKSGDRLGTIEEDSFQ